jgi:tRNA-specific 2-thiouridylase
MEISKPEGNKRVVVAMSGGVDSSVSAALLVEQGYEVLGIMLRLWTEQGPATQRDNRCCTRDQMLSAHFVARKLGIPFHVIDARDIFKRHVVDAFIEGYAQGITPNPCLACNRHIRFGYLLEEALARGAAYLATGHYARITCSEDGLLELRKGIDPDKDQSYVLSVLTQDQLRHTMFPIGNLSKSEVRALARRFDLPVADKRDSQDLCFIADGDYRRFMHDMAAQAFKPGPIRLKSGPQIGEHTGLPNYTIGQRKGLGIAWPEPLYVIAKDAVNNTLWVGTRDEMGNDHLFARGMNWIDGAGPTDEMRAEVKIRYKARPVTARILPLDQTTVEVWLDEPLLDITPGQGAVFYKGDKVLGCGLIALPS